MSNPFAQAEAWTVSLNTLLPKGNHRVRIEECVDDGTSKGGHPQIKVRMSNAEGMTTDWIVVDPVGGVRKVVGLAEAAGVDRPGEDDLVGGTTRLVAGYLGRFVGKEVGVVIREEKNDLDPSKPPRLRVQGYVEADRIPAPSASDVTSPNAATGFQAAPSAPVDDDLPF